MFTYLLLNVGTLLFPLLFSFESKVNFYSKWKFALPAILITAIYFLVWDYFFTSHGIWSFNSAYVIKVYIGGLPLEELLFFICIPYACLFIYAVLKDYVLRGIQVKHFNYFIVPLIVFLFIAGIAFWSQTYTSVTCISTALLLSFLVFFRKVGYLPFFFAMYLIHLLPFVIINGILTALPVVSYNNLYNSGIRLGTIPVEDLLYSMLMLLMNVAIYEALYYKSKRKVVA